MLSLLLSNCVFASDCEIIHKSVKFYEKQDLSNVCTLYNLANEFYLRHKYQKALNTYEDIITINPKEERAYIKRARIYNEFNNREKANREYMRLVKNVPDSLKGNDMMAHFHKYVSEDYEKALNYINKVIELTNGEQVSYFYDRANILEKMGRYEEAIADYTKYVKSNEDNYSAYFELSYCYKAVGNKSKAKEAILKWDYGYQKNKHKYKLTLAEKVSLHYSEFKNKFYTDKLY